MTLTIPLTSKVVLHYTPVDNALEAVLATLSQDHSILTLAELAGADQFHAGGVEATQALAKRAAITAADRVLDIGGGFGGPARWLAQEIGCHVTVVDLTEAYCRIGEKLTERTGLTDRVQFQQGNALDLPFNTGSFDVVWTQHASMNIPNKAGLYDQIQRVLRPGGRLALHEVTAGSGASVHFPVPWARTEATSFLQSQEDFRTTVAQAGFREWEWADLSDWTIAWFQAMQRTTQVGSVVADQLGLGRLFGPEAGPMVRNFAVNVQESRVRVVQGVFERL